MIKGDLGRKAMKVTGFWGCFQGLVFMRVFSTLVLLFGISHFVHAQVATSISPTPGAGALGTTVTQAGILYNITGGTRTGTNLFHSFGNFNVGAGDTANFLNTPVNGSLPLTSNILGRVTGGNVSNIFGTIQTSGFGNANLFLVNPTGFFFGPNATVNVGGMVAFTSADYMRLADGGRFNAFSNATPPDILTSAPVATFGFLGSNPGAITIHGSQLTVTQGISLVGGNITIESGIPDGGTPRPARLSASGGQINLASVASPGELSLVDFLPTSGMTMGNISLSQKASLDVSGNAAGAVRIRAGQLVMDQAAITADSFNADGAPVAIDIDVTGNVSISTTDVPALTALTTGTGNGGDVKIASGTTEITGTAIDSFLFSVIDTHTSGPGKAGNVSIDTGELNFTAIQFAGMPMFVDSGTISPNGGHGGDITIRAHNFIANDTAINSGNTLALQLGEDSTGSAGNISITANSLEFLNVGIVADAFSLFADSFNQIGRSGNILINVPNLSLDFGFVTTLGGERGGTLLIDTDHFTANGTQLAAQTFLLPGGGISIRGSVIELTNGGFIVSSTGGDGNAGPINITATDHLSLLRVNPDDLISGIFSNSFGSVSSLGNAGDITITTPRLEMRGGARINTSTATSGRGGNVSINAETITMSGEAGDQRPEPLFNLGVTQPSGIFTLSVGGQCSGPCGNAGNISINTGSLSMGTGSQINSGTNSSGQGGNITITASDTIAMSGTLSTGQSGGIQSRSVGTDLDAGSGGNIAITAGQSVSISDGASVSASTGGSGNAGNILVKANDISISGGGTITAASTGSGNAGTVTIEGPNSPANSFLIDGTGSGVFTNSEDTGIGGSISVDANAITLQNGGTISASTSGSSSNATGGNISISGGQFVQMNNGALITASSTGPGNAGNIIVDAGPQLVMQNSSIKTEAAKAGGGNIEIQAVDLVQLGNSTVSTSVLGGTGSGGNITIDPNLVLLQNSQIIAQAVQGAGGNISITTNLLMPDSTSLISASSQFGQQGNIVIQSPVSPASGKLVPLGQKPLIATSLLSQRCAAIAGGSISSFTVAGRDSLPAEPGGWVSSPLALSISESENVPVKEADGMMSDEAPLLSLRKIAPSGFLTQAFAVDASGCS
jgi:filamentous hemagglutinin family protein